MPVCGPVCLCVPVCVPVCEPVCMCVCVCVWLNFCIFVRKDLQQSITSHEDGNMMAQARISLFEQDSKLWLGIRAQY